MRARAGASRSPSGAGIWATTSLSSSSTPSPVFALTCKHVRRRAADDVGQFGGVLLRLGCRQVDLVEHRDDHQVVLQSQPQVRQRLRLDALCGVDEENGPFTCRETAGHLVGEVDVPGGVDEVQHVGAVVGRGERQAHGLGLDRDAALPLDVHPIEVLRAHRAVVDDAGDLQHPVGQCRLAVVDVRDDAEVAQGVSRGVARGRGGTRGCRHVPIVSRCRQPTGRGPHASRYAW